MTKIRATVITLDRNVIIDPHKLQVTLQIRFATREVAKVLRVDQEIELEIVEETD